MRLATKHLLPVALLLAAADPTTAHSWVDRLMRVATNGTMFGTAGFIRGYAERGTPGYNDGLDTYLIPPNGRSTGKTILKTDKICHPSQTIGNYTSQFPRLTTAPGDLIALRYQENGHVTSPATQQGKPTNRGTVYIYGTEDPSNDDTLLAIHNVWTADGQGGDKRGRLLSTRNFDDGQCYQVNPNSALSRQRMAEFPKKAEDPQGGDLWCQSDVQLPDDVSANGTYTLYWVWDWPTLKDPSGDQSDPNNILTPEVYTSCMELDVVNPCSNTLGGVKSPACQAGGTTGKLSKALLGHFVKSQDRNSIAIYDQMSSNFDVSVAGAPGSSGSAPSTAISGGLASPTTSAPTTLQTRTSGRPRVKTVYVTVTDNIATVTVTRTEDPTAVTSASVVPSTTSSSAEAASTALPQSASSVRAPGANGSGNNPPSVTPFMRAKRSPRRAAGERGLGRA